MDKFTEQDLLDVRRASRLLNERTQEIHYFFALLGNLSCTRPCTLLATSIRDGMLQTVLEGNRVRITLLAKGHSPAVLWDGKKFQPPKHEFVIPVWRALPSLFSKLCDCVDIEPRLTMMLDIVRDVRSV